MMTEESTGAWRAPLGWGALALLFLYAGLIHHGIGPYPDGALHAWNPRGFLIEQSWIEPFEERPLLGIAAFTIPAALLVVAVFMLTSSATAHTLSLTALLATALFCFYGLREPGPGIWNFFQWRSSGVMVGLSFAVAATCAAPLLARSWLRLPWALRAAVYLPVFLLVVVVIRNVTGTDESLRFAISPWPVIPVFGFSFGSVAILGMILGMFAATRLFAPDANGELPRRELRAVGIVVGIVVPAVWFWAWHQTFPVEGMVLFSAIAAVCVGLAVAPALRAPDERMGARSRNLAVGFLLATLPLIAGEGLAKMDYMRTREGTARVLIDALQSYMEKRDEYPDKLSELVEGGFLDQLPRPSIGFGFLGGQEFQYQGFGTSYNLEFAAGEWIQCAYNPAWAGDEDYADEDYADADEDYADADEDYAGEDEDYADEDQDAELASEGDAGEGSLDEAWSCPSSPPELW